MPPQNEVTDLLETDISFSLERLFDPYNMDHVPVEQRLDSFKQRDLYHVRHYKAAVKIFGGPLSRKRVIIAPPMETPLKHRLGLYHNVKTFPPPPAMNSELKPQTPPAKEPSKEIIAAKSEQEKIDKYKSWMSERMKLRDNLENMGLNEKWLQRKGHMSEVEARVMNRLRADRLKEPEVVLRKVRTRPALPEPCVPKVHTPSPQALHAMEQFLKENRLRLVDVFQQVDKDKSWTLSKDEFLNAIRKMKLPIEKDKLEELITALDENLNEVIEYNELSKGMGILRLERRAKKREQLSLSGSATPASASSSASSKKWAGRLQNVSGNDVQSLNMSDEQETRLDLTMSEAERRRPASGRSTARSGSASSQYLEPPEPDLRLEQYIQDEETMVDLCKCAKDLLKYRASSGKNRSTPPSAIRVGYKPIDDHLMRSTLDPDKAEIIEVFRHRRLQEYENIIKLCKDNNIVLTRKLLDRVLLYPPERPHHEMLEQISRNWHLRHKALKRQFSGTKSRKSRRASRPVDSNLDNGGVASKVDCWINFDEYCKLTGYKPWHIDDNAFWPGHLLDKLRLCMPPYDGTMPPPDNRHAIFQEMKKTKRSNHGYDNNVRWWPPGQRGYVQYADCETFHRRLLD